MFRVESGSRLPQGLTAAARLAAGAAFCLNVLAVTLATLNIVGWYAHIVFLVRWRDSYSPMQFDTALLVGLCALGVLFLRGRADVTCIHAEGFRRAPTSASNCRTSSYPVRDAGVETKPKWGRDPGCRRGSGCAADRTIRRGPADLPVQDQTSVGRKLGRNCANEPGHIFWARTSPEARP